MNIIYLSTDTFRYDNVFGPSPLPIRTPALEAFAGRATVLHNMIMGSFPTIPQRTDVFTGRFGWPWYGWQDIGRSSPNRLPRMLKKAGYVSQLLCDCPHLFNCGFNGAFDAAEAIRGQEGDLPYLHMNDPMANVMPREKTRKGSHFQGASLVDQHRWTNFQQRYEGDLFMARTAQRTMQWLEDNYRHDPFFLWVDFFDPHEPWDPPQYLVRRYDPDYSGPLMQHPNYGRADDFTEAELKNLVAHYYAESELVDRWLGRVLQKVDDLQLWGNTIVVVASDHGVSLGEHNRTGKSNINDNDDRYWPTYPEVAHELFMIAAPGLQGGGSRNLIAQPADIAPTLLDLCGVEAQPPEPMHGRSFAAALRGDVADRHRDAAICASFLGGIDYNQVPGKAVTPALYTQDWIYIPVGADGKTELYDRRTDPLATNNVAAGQDAVIAQLSDMFTAWLSEHDAPAAVAKLYRAGR